MKKLAFNFFLAGMTLAVMLVSTEGMIRLFAPQLTYRFPRDLFAADASTSYRLRSGYEGVLDTPEYRTSIRVTSQGLRDDREYLEKTDGELRILMLGDSFVMGVGVDLEETVVEQLEDTLDERFLERDVEIINMGVPGYSTRQALATLETYGDDLDADLVILGFFVGNDFSENAGEPLRVDDGYLVDGTRHEGLIPYPVRRFIKLHSQFYHFLWPIQRRLRGHGGAEAGESARRIAEIFLIDEEVARPITQPSLEALEDLVRACEERGLPLAVMIIPDHAQVVDGPWDALIDQTGAPRSVYDRAAPSRRIAKFLEARGVPTLDLLPGFRAREDRDALYLPLDKHWTAIGHDVATVAATRFIGAIIDGNTQLARAAGTKPVRRAD
ncbi:MAG: hypothetical protein E4H03_05145 [Myxococcales bacterium]|nr:MAG: hypothetical protein E4H03_05145 [Myxococcales bacterium]